MSRELVLPGTAAFCTFVEAYFADREFEVDTKSKAGHIVYRIPSHWQNVSVPRNRKQLVRSTFHDLLTDMGTNVKFYRNVAGTPAKLKQYAKSRRRDAGGTDETPAPRL